MGTPGAWGCHRARPLPGTPVPIVETRSMAFRPKHQRGGKPVPPVTTAQHGVRTGYLYGCRCIKCRQAERDYQRQRRQAIRNGEVGWPHQQGGAIPILSMRYQHGKTWTAYTVDAGAMNAAGS
jgi:hypothetical protein